MPAKLLVAYYSTYGHTVTLAEEIAKGMKEVADVEVEIKQIEETLSPEVLQKMYAAPKADYPVVSADELPHYDGIAWGIPTRYGRTPAQVSSLFDHTGKLWATGALVGKFATIFSGSASQHGGQETTMLTTYPFFAHHGTTIVPIGFAAPELSDATEIVGGSAYGAASISKSDGSRAVSEKEKSIARYQGKYFASTVATFVKGKSL